jgi:hypothetical protein
MQLFFLGTCLLVPRRIYLEWWRSSVVFLLHLLLFLATIITTITTISGAPFWPHPRIEEPPRHLTAARGRHHCL